MEQAHRSSDSKDFLTLQAEIFNELRQKAIQYSPIEPDNVELDKLATNLAHKYLIDSGKMDG